MKPIEAEKTKEGPFNKELKAAVKYLYSEGIIQEDQDIAIAVDLDKSTISPYLNGKKQASKNFVKAFEEFYKLSLDDFREENPRTLLPGKHNVTLQDHINLLYDYNNYLKNGINLNLKGLSDHQELLSAQIMAIFDTAVEKEAKGDGKKAEALFQQIYKHISDRLPSHLKEGI